MKNRNKCFLQSLVFTLLATAMLLVLSFRIGVPTLLLFGLVVFFAFMLSVYAVNIYSQKLFKAAFILWLVLFVVEAAYIALSYTGFIEVFSDTSYIKRLLDATGPWAKVVFVAISFLQVTVVPIPSTITVMAGSVIFGLWESVLLSLAGIIAGSMFAFFLGRIFGVRLVKWVVGEEMLKKYQNITNGRDTVLLFFMFLLPMFPDDILCLIAGLTKMSYLKFFLIQILGRPVGTIAVAALVGDGGISIPFAGWGILAWIAIAVAILLAFYILLKYSQPAMLWFKDLITRRRREKYGYGHINSELINETIVDKVSDTQILRTIDVFFTRPKIEIKEQKRLERKMIKSVMDARKKF